MLRRFEEFCSIISAIQHNIQKIERDEMEKYGLKGPYAQYLVTMSRCPEGITAAQLSEMCDKDKAAVSRALAELLTEAKEYIDGHKYAGTGLEELEEAYDNASPYFTVADDGTIIVQEGVPLAKLVDHIDALANTLNAFDDVP